jgi:hypothetical protein
MEMNFQMKYSDSALVFTFCFIYINVINFLEQKTWYHVPVYGITPAGRAQHSAVVYGKEMYVFGGSGTQSITFGDFYAFNFGF